MARFNLNNHSIFKGYVERLFLSEDEQMLFLKLAVKRNYKNTRRNPETGKEEKKYLYDFIPVKVQWEQVKWLRENPRFKKGCYMLVSVAAQTYRMSIKENQLVSFAPGEGLPIVDQLVFVLNEYEIFQEREAPKGTHEPKLDREQTDETEVASLASTEPEVDSDAQDSSIMEPINYSQLFSAGYSDRY